MKSEFSGGVLLVRAVEDCIRATRKYTKGAFTSKVIRPVQDAKSPVRVQVVTEYYEVYPDLEISWDMKAVDAWAWVWGDVTRIDVKFYYDYRCNRGEIVVHGGRDAVKELVAGIPELAGRLARLRYKDAELASIVVLKGLLADGTVAPEPNTSPASRKPQKVTLKAK